MSRRTLLPRLALALGALALAVGGPELGLRLAGHGPRLDKSEMANDPDTLWALRPGAVRPMGRDTHVNRLGLQGPEPTGQARRVLVTGDSSVFGVNIGDARSFSQVLEERLGQGVEVHNGGVPGYSSAQSLALARKAWPALEPELLVVANQWSDNNFDSFVDSEALAQAGSPRQRAAHALARGAERSAVLMALLRWRGAGQQEVVAWGQLQQETMGGRRRVPLAEYRDNLEALAALALDGGASVIFLSLANVDDLDHPGRTWPWDPYRQVLAGVAAHRGCPLVEALAVFAASGRASGQLFVDEMHPSATGHQLLGEALARVAAAGGWAEGKPLCTGQGPEGTLPADPWTWPEGTPATASTPTVAGLVVGNPDRMIQLEVQLVAFDGQILDRVGLPAAAPYALQADPAPSSAVVRVVEVGYRSRHLAQAPVQLAAGPAWGFDLALPDLGPVAARPGGPR